MSVAAGPAVAHTRAGVRSAISEARAHGARVGLVPTMGALHDGHLSLVDAARAEAELVVLSIFVNPLQFAPGEDLDRYPRDLAGDLARAASRGVDLVFAPSVDEMYPRGDPAISVVPAGSLAERLDGASRPGHFRGVLTVVARLFGIVRPDVAVFGQKDFQQAALIRRMAEELEMGIELRVAPIVRDPDGLAMSSRNVYLSAPDRRRALSLSAGLSRGRALFDAGERDAGTLRAALRHAMGEEGVQVEYAEVVDPATLDSVGVAEPGSVMLVAARVGGTRLIDNAILG
jgi:pantoate--beta-alanine ligase